MKKKRSKRVFSYAKKHEIHPAHKFHYIMIGVVLLLCLIIIIAGTYTVYTLNTEKNACSLKDKVEERDNCYLQFAINSHDKSVCTEIIITYLRESCYALD